MPFTPFHMGAALIVKPAARGHFSVISFGLAQIAIDIEPLIGILRGAEILHGMTHTFVGAIVIGIFVALIAPYFARPILRGYNQELRAHKLEWLCELEAPSRSAMWSGALFGTTSHIVLDSLMHHDIQPFAPFSDANPFLGVVSIGALHLICVALGFIGAGAWVVSKFRSKSAR
jgi:membrane-bound metal-dependent hydrolase YbcI (DUF457 family)